MKSIAKKVKGELYWKNTLNALEILRATDEQIEGAEHELSEQLLADFKSHNLAVRANVDSLCSLFNLLKNEIARAKDFKKSWDADIKTLTELENKLKNYAKDSANKMGGVLHGNYERLQCIRSQGSVKSDYPIKSISVSNVMEESHFLDWSSKADVTPFYEIVTMVRIKKDSIKNQLKLGKEVSGFSLDESSQLRTYKQK